MNICRHMAEKQKPYPAWCCDGCGAPIGYLGRFFQWLRLPLHRCHF